MNLYGRSMMPSIRSSRPPEPDAAAVLDVLDEVLLLLIEAGCKYVREHPEARVKLSASVGDALLEVGVDRDAIEVTR
jgi:hypothetical protein